MGSTASSAYGKCPKNVARSLHIVLPRYIPMRHVLLETERRLAGLELDKNDLTEYIIHRLLSSAGGDPKDFLAWRAQQRPYAMSLRAWVCFYAQSMLGKSSALEGVLLEALAHRRCAPQHCRSVLFQELGFGWEEWKRINDPR